MSGGRLRAEFGLEFRGSIRSIRKQDYDCLLNSLPRFFGPFADGARPRTVYS